MKILSPLCCLVFFLGLAMSAESNHPSELMMISQFEGANDEPEWFSVDDGVMGGLSEGKPVIEDGSLNFSGKLSLKNNSGFSSLRSGERKYDLTGKNGFVMRVKGDGRTYKMRIETDARFNGSEIGYQADFKTQKGKFIEVRVPFDSFNPGWRGRKLDGPPMDLSMVEEIGLVLADGKEGPFEIELDWLGVE